MDTPDQIVEARGVQKEDSKETLSSSEASAAADANMGGEQLLAANPEPSTLRKRKRGRPRKSDVAERVMDPPPTPAPSLVLLGLPAPHPPAESSSTPARHRRERPKKTYKIKLLRTPPTGLDHDVGSSFMAYVLTVPAGGDIIQELLAYAQDDNRTVVPLAATGFVSSVTFHSSNPGGDKTTYEGHFAINVLQGSLNRKYALLTLWMTDPEGQHIGGCLAGPLIAGNHVQIIFGQFEDVVDRKYKRKQRQANASTVTEEVDHGGPVDVPVHAGEMGEANANDSSPGPEGSDEGEPIMATAITIVPPALSLHDGLDEEEPIAASPISIVPPASSLPEELDEEEPIAAIPISFVPPALSLAEGPDEEELIVASPITVVPPALSLPERSDEEEPIMASPITVVPPASSPPETPDDQNESAATSGSDPEK